MKKKGKHLFSSESVTEGHPDKICDQVSDAILDEVIKGDPNGHVCCEAATKTGMVLVFGEISTKTYVDIPSVVRGVLKRIGYTNADYGISYENCAVLTAISEQSGDIAQGELGTGKHQGEQGAGDQGMMFGYATNETPSYMPLTIDLAHKLVMKLAEVRKNGDLPYLRPDGKSQVTVEYDNGEPQWVTNVVIAIQHDPDVEYEDLRKDIIEQIIKTTVPEKYIRPETVFYINETGKFVVGGPQADSGLTGRKIIVDTYGGVGAHGGGCFSGKSPNKPDRAGAYMARYIAKNLVAAGLAEQCEVQLAYVIGVPHPTSVMVNTFGTGKVDDSKLEEIVKKHFSLTPSGMIKELDLLRPIYEKTAAYGHFGRDDPDFTWEKIDKADELKKAAK